MPDWKTQQMIKALRATPCASCRASKTYTTSWDINLALDAQDYQTVMLLIDQSI